MKKTVNLWNLSHKKTRSTIRYIENLYPNDNWSTAQHEFFNKTVKKALSKVTANEMLETIGYRYNKMPKFYDKIYDMK